MLDKVEVATYRRLPVKEGRKKVYSKVPRSGAPARFNMSRVLAILNVIFIKEKLVICTGGFFLGRVMIFGEYSPFFLPYLAAVAIKGDGVRTFLAGLSLMAGYMSVHGIFNISEVSTFLLAGAILTLLSGNLSEKARKKGIGVAVLTIFTYFITRISCEFFLNTGPTNAFFIFIEALFIGVLTIIFIFGIRPLDNSGRYTSLRREELGGLMLIGAGVISGLPYIHLGNFSLNDVILKLIIMIMASAGGMGIGTIVGLALGLLSTMAVEGASPLIVGLYGCGGLIAGMFREYGRPGIVLGLFTGNALLSFQFSTANAIISSFGGTGLAALGFVIFPHRYIELIGRYLTNPLEKLKRDAAYQRKLRKVVSERLEDFSKIFTELARTFEGALQTPETSQRGDVISLLKLLSQRACQGCRGYQTCWEANFHQTYKELIELLIIAEKKSGISGPDLSEELRKRCIQGYKLISAINYLVEMCKADKYWRERFHESQGMVSEQLKGVARLMGQLSDEVTIDAEFKEEIEARISSKLKSMGFPICSVSAISMGEQEVEITICKKRCRGERDCTNMISPIVSNLLGRGFAIWKESCALESGKGECEFRLLPARSFEIEVETIKAPKNDGIISGDNHSILELKDGKIALILSDGMGSGPEAALESGATVALLERLINAGFDSEFAIRTINSVLLLRSAEENFATVDLTLLDLYTGNADFIKIGASPTFIIRGKHIEVIRGSSLPAGIVSSVNADRESKRLKDGDILVMMTDGILDSCREVVEREEWVAGVLSRAVSREPREMAEWLVRTACEKAGGKRDDMTVIVARVKNKFSTSLLQLEKMRKKSPFEQKMVRDRSILP